jgi:uncharacterized protein
MAVPPAWGRVWQARVRVKYVLLYESADDARAKAPAIFRSREAAEEFAKSDPFVTEGVVRRWEIREWNEALT